jgi:hypothetical protein
MGSEIGLHSAGKRPLVSVRCEGSNGIDHIRIVKDGRVVHTHPCHGEWTCDLEWEDPAFGQDRPSWYYARVVQVDRESAWSSPVWIG